MSTTRMSSAKSTPLVAIVGRPNVGKSTLFNRLAGQAIAIVHDAPGVTRDRNYSDTNIQGRDITLVDTGGFDRTTDDPMGQGIARHVEAAIAEAHVIICVLDGSLPPTESDQDAVKLLRRSDKPVLYVANKIDGKAKDWLLSEHYELGVNHILGISALHGRHTGELEAAILRALPEETTHEREEEDERLRVAFIGRPNAGKSSLLNRLSGEERSLVDSRPGTTRDPVDSEITYKGQRFLIVDTAGVRRKSKVDKGIEAHSVLRSIRVLGRTDVVVVMVDVTEGLAEQDARLLGLAIDRGRAVVVGLNKVDLLPQRDIKKACEDARHELHFSKWTPVIPLSAKSGHGVHQLMAEVAEAGKRMQKRVSTSELNQFFERVIQEHPPPTRAGKAPRIYYLTQTGVTPPTFVAFTSAPDHIDESYKRFITNRIRETFGYEAVPLRLYFRGKTREE